jgi:hypothetical protein
LWVDIIIERLVSRDSDQEMPEQKILVRSPRHAVASCARSVNDAHT